LAKEVDLRLVVADDGFGVAQAGLCGCVLGLKDVQRGHGSRDQVGLGEAEGLIGCFDLLVCQADEAAICSDERLV
jgi:hypothetical protein